MIAIAAASVERTRKAPNAFSKRNVSFLVLPFVLAYIALLMPRALYIFTVDRYLVFLTPFAVLVLLRLYERIGASGFGPLAWTTLALMGGYTVTTTHDLFAVHRANLQAINEVRDTGVPRDEISGGAEYNAYTQLLEGGFVHAAPLLMPDGSIFRGGPAVPYNACSSSERAFVPALRPLYAIAYPDSLCVPVSGFAPVSFSTWLPPFKRTAVIVFYGRLR